MSEYVVLISNSPEHRKGVHRHIVDAASVKNAAHLGTEMCSHGREVDTVIEVFAHAGTFYQFGLEEFEFPTFGTT